MADGSVYVADVGWSCFKKFYFLLRKGNGRAAGTGPPHPLGVLTGHLIAGKDGLGSTAGCAG